MTAKPAEVFSLPWGKLEVGSPADVTIIDLDAKVQVNKESIVSKSKNTPFIGIELQGWPVLTIASGQIVWS
jgi:dihydroorotase